MSCIDGQLYIYNFISPDKHVSIFFFQMNNKLLPIPPAVIGQGAPVELMANMRLRLLRSGAQLSLPPRCIRTHAAGGAADRISDVLYLERFQG